MGALSHRVANSTKVQGYPLAFWMMWLGQLLGRAGTLVPAFMVLYLQRDRQLNDAATSLLVSMFGAGLVLAGFIGGALASRIGPKRLILIVQPLIIITAMSMIAVHSIYLYGVLTFIAGFLSILDRPAAASIILRSVGREKFSQAYGLYLMGFNVGMTFAPVASGFLIDIKPSLIFILWMISAAAFFFCVTMVPLKRIGVEKDESSKQPGLRHSLTAPYKDRYVVLFLLLTFFVAAIYLQMNSALPLHMTSVGLNGSEIGLVLAVNAVLSIILLPLVPKLVAGWHQVSPLIVATLLIGVGFGANMFASSSAGFVVALIIWTFGEVLWAPMSANFLTRQASDELVSSYQSSFFLSWNSALMVGAPVGMWLADKIDFSGLWMCAFILSLYATVGFMYLQKKVPP